MTNPGERTKKSSGEVEFQAESPPEEVKEEAKGNYIHIIYAQQGGGGV